ncbi:PUA domain-containing protein [Ignicoccus pacificus DSM 13166]|uniref:PUA domain-containing protein n=1 Tax=Ignicoccus pacificus DSM 13166 TaxID=940294 RepID=A0A977KAH6_9CREN|nr:PUA domain-containing protein [Ignicoccus pacificus DSM 13166]
MPQNFDILKLLSFIYQVPLECEEFKDVKIKFSRTGMPRYVLNKKGERLFTVRPNDFLLTLSDLSARILFDCLPGNSGKVYVSEIPTKTVFNKHVIDADPKILRGIDVLVVYNDSLIAYGRSVLSGEEMVKINFGEAVKIRGKIK